MPRRLDSTPGRGPVPWNEGPTVVDDTKACRRRGVLGRQNRPAQLADGSPCQPELRGKLISPFLTALTTASIFERASSCSTADLSAARTASGVMSSAAATSATT